MDLPFNTTISNIKGAFYTNYSNSKTAKVEKLYIVNYQSIGADDIELWISNDGREVPLLKTIMAINTLIEFVGPLYLNESDMLIGRTSNTHGNVTVSIQGVMVNK